MNESREKRIEKLKGTKLPVDNIVVMTKDVISGEFPYKEKFALLIKREGGDIEWHMGKGYPAIVLTGPYLGTRTDLEVADSVMRVRLQDGYHFGHRGKIEYYRNYVYNGGKILPGEFTLADLQKDIEEDNELLKNEAFNEYQYKLQKHERKNQVDELFDTLEELFKD